MLPMEELQKRARASASTTRGPEWASRTTLNDFRMTETEQTYYHTQVSDSGDEKYHLQDILATGGIGAVFTVVDQILHRSLAMKVLSPELKTDAERVRHFMTEAKITAFLEHPGIIPIHELGLLPDVGIFFTMNRVQGETLHTILQRLRSEETEYVNTYTPYRLLRIFQKVCDTLSFAHSNHLLHLDIKPHNILVGKYGEVFLMDWGLAKIIGDPANEDDPVRRAFLEELADALKRKDDRIEGSPAFMSPEQARGEFDHLDVRSDIFLLGAALYDMFTLEPPYTGAHVYDVLHNAQQRNLIPPKKRSPARQIPEEICRMILKAMAFHPDDRYQTVEDLSSDIDNLIAGKWGKQDIKTFHAGDMLMREGDIGEEAYVILQGSVVITTKNEHGSVLILRTCEAGDMVGEMALISKEPRSATVQALDETTAAVLTREVIARHLHKLPPYMEQIVSTLTHRLQTLSTRIHPHLTTDSTWAVIKHLRLLALDQAKGHVEKAGLPLHAICEEIAEDLGIPEHIVHDVLSKASDQKILSCVHEMISIPDLDELLQYARRHKPGVRTS